jgi:hypothetical protein
MDIELREISFWIAVFAAIIAFAGILSASMQPILLPVAIFVAGTAVLLLLRMVFSQTYRRGIDALNREMRGDDPWPGRRKKLSDPEWGAFGSRTGSPALQWLRAILVFGVVPIALFQKLIGTDVVALWASGAFVVMELTLMHVALSQPR